MRSRKVDALKLLLCIFFAVTVIYPLCTMLIKVKDVNIIAIWGSEQLIRALVNSLVLSGIATVISLVIAFGLAWCIERSDMKGKALVKIIATIPMLIPSISHGMGLIILFGSNGILTNLFHLKSTIYGPVGIVTGSVMYAFPVAFLMFLDVIRYEDGNAYQAATILGIPKWNQFVRLTCSYLKKPLISIVFATFTLIVTDYGVPLMIGGKCTTLPVLMYEDVIGLLDFGKGSAIGIILLIPAILAFVIDMLNKDRGNGGSVHIPYQTGKNKVRDILAQVYCTVVSIGVIVPVLTFVVLPFMKKYPINMSFSLDHVSRTFDMSGGQYLLNSVIIAVVVSVVGIVTAFLIAYLTARLQSKVSRLLHLISIISLAIPGIVLGLSYVLAFKKWPIYGTLIILIMVNLIHFFSNPYLMMYNTLGKLNVNLEAIGSTLGIPRWYVIKDVIIPLTRNTMLEMFSYFFVNSMMTISAVSFLATIKNKPIALMITQFEAQMMIECSAFVSLMILVINLVTKYVIYLLKKRYSG